MAPKVLVGIFSATTLESGKTAYAVHARLASSETEWTVLRRYSEFLELRDDLVSFFARCMVPQCFGCRWFVQSLNGFAFPRRRMLRSHDPEVIQRRKSALDQFARLLASHAFSAIPKCVSCSKLPFARVRDFFIKDATFAPPVTFRLITDALQVENLSAIADPSKSKIEFRRGHGILKMLQVEKPVHSKRTSVAQAFRDQVEQDQRKAMQRKMSLHAPDRRVSINSSPEGSDRDALNATIIHVEEIHASDNDDSDDDLGAMGAGIDELDMTGVEIDISREGSAHHLAPLRDPSAPSLWQPRDFPPPAKVRS